MHQGPPRRRLQCGSSWDFTLGASVACGLVGAANAVLLRRERRRCLAHGRLLARVLEEGVRERGEDEDDREEIDDFRAPAPALSASPQDNGLLDGGNEDRRIAAAGVRRPDRGVKHPPSFLPPPFPPTPPIPLPPGFPR